MDENTRSILLGLSAIYLLAAIALVLTFTRSLQSGPSVRLSKMVNLFLIGIACQCFHFMEEFVTGFYILFPQFLNLAPWSPGFFVAFNLSWIAIWSVSAVGVLHGYRIAFFPVWFFALGMLANVIAHPLLAVANGGYFPGLVTSPLVGVMGFLLVRQLFQLTAAEAG